MRRYILEPVKRDLEHKIVLLSGPRQVGKTTFSTSIFDTHTYLNWDYGEDRKDILDLAWDRKNPIIILDEIHKMSSFKAWLKGIYDVEGIPPRLLVTGSARLDIAKKMGDSLAGRFFPYRLFPLDLWELNQNNRLDSPQQTYQELIQYSGFPEPFLKQDTTFYRRWASTHLDLILRQDLLDLEQVQSISKIETLMLRLQNMVGSSISYASLSRDLEVSPKTIKRWLGILENLFIIFKVTPYHRNIARSILKEPKYYFFDVKRVQTGEGAIFENMVALSLLKHSHFMKDHQGIMSQLYYLRTKDGREIDFYLDIKRQPGALIECKLQDTKPAKAFKTFAPYFKGARYIQLIHTLRQDKTYPSGLEVRNAMQWLTDMNLINPS